MLEDKRDDRGSPCADTNGERTNERHEPISSTAPSDKISVLFFCSVTTTSNILNGNEENAIMMTNPS